MDTLQHVKNVVYVQWVQDAAYAHGMTKAPASIQELYKWVVLQHEIEYKAPSFLNEELVAKTWVFDYEGVKSTRVVQIIRKNDNSCWLMPARFGV